MKLSKLLLILILLTCVSCKEPNNITVIETPSPTEAIINKNDQKDLISFIL